MTKLNVPYMKQWSVFVEFKHATMFRKFMLYTERTATLKHYMRSRSYTTRIAEFVFEEDPQSFVNTFPEDQVKITVTDL